MPSKLPKQRLREYTQPLNHNTYEDDAAKHPGVSEALLADGQRQNDTGNKAAGRRARKASLELEKILKEFRKISLASGKR